MYFVFIGTDKVNSFDLRRQTKIKHSSYLDSPASAVRVLMSGPTLDTESRENGSVMILEATDRKEIEAFFLREPYHLVGLYETTELRPWDWKRGNFNR